MLQVFEIFLNPAKHGRLNMGSEAKIIVENVNVPGHVTRVNAEKYEAMKTAMLTVLPKHEPGLTQNEIRKAVLPHLPEELFPGGATAGWWVKTVQLDLEARGVVIREKSKPLRWYRNG